MPKTTNQTDPYNKEKSPVKENNDDTIDLDDVLPKIGEFGIYQKFLLWFVCLPACLPCGFCAFNQLFMTDTPDHWCRVPELSNMTLENRKMLSIPRKVDGDNNTVFENCVRYSVNWKTILSNGGTIKVNESWPVEPCLDGYEYDTSEVQSSIVIDFDLVCEYDVYPTLGLVALNIGGPIGVYSFGILNDRIGRKKSFFACLSTLLLGSMMTAYAQAYWFWVLARVIVGLTIPAVYQIPFIISLELAGPNYRSFVTVMTCIFYTLGLILLSGVTYMLRDWKQLALATSVPFFFYYLYWFILPESPRWLLMMERLEEANKILQTIARINGKELPVEYTEKIQRQVLDQKEHGLKETKAPSVFALCKTPNLRLKTILITLNWCASEMVYVGLSYYGPSMGSNQYMSFFLSSAVEIPSYIICWILMDKVGRRWPLCLSMVISGIFCMITVLLPSDAETETLVLYLISKSLISASFLIIYPYAGELYPTELRGIGIGTSAYIGGLGLIIIPFINYLGTSNLVLPLFLMGALSVVGGITALRLPETLHCPLPQTAEEGEEFGKDWTYKDCCTCGGPGGVPEADSYENLDQMELTQAPLMEDTLSDLPIRRSSMKKLVRQASTLETQRDIDGTLKMTYWF
ncbi:carcinine transporter [Danaus plexippus]|uniref:Organic cation transporter n=1 Tax=Danaus plexippus plexippus TaxID=278856 RepID=A0A212FFN8_DANPL|nr:carcinine transporter [Danaus plexippus]OWR52533.1 organic cation transporter [Danaus plexippus plexippus]